MRYFIGTLIAIALIIVIIVLLLTGGSKPAPQPINLSNLSTTGDKVQLVIDGEVTANSEHREIRITVGRRTSTVDVIKGYRGEVISSHTVDNNSDAYYVFLKALELAGFNLGKSGPSYNPGFCPLGQRHIYKVISATGKVRQSFWGSTCGGGSFTGNANLIITLFQKQIPKYDDYTSDVSL